MQMKLEHGDCLKVLKKMRKNFVDSIVTDPPYGISCLGKGWDKSLPQGEIWQECFRVLKPGGYILAFASARLYPHLAISLEQVGFETQNMLAWLYGNGFPKGRNLSLELDKNEKTCPKESQKKRGSKGVHLQGLGREFDKYAPKSEWAKKWKGWRYGKMSLRPCIEPIYFGQKPPLSPIGKNIERYGVGAINIEGHRYKGDDGKLRHPTNVIHDESRQVVQALEKSSPGSSSFFQGLGSGQEPFFYVAKPSKKERRGNPHPTVKPIALMKHLVCLVTPLRGLCLDPFMGSGTTALACLEERRRFRGIEREKAYYKMAKRRLKKAALSNKQ